MEVKVGDNYKNHFSVPPFLLSPLGFQLAKARRLIYISPGINFA